MGIFLVVGSGFCLFLAFSFRFAGFLFVWEWGCCFCSVVFTCQRSMSSLAFSPSECWVSCNNPKAAGQCKMEMQFKVLSIRMDKRRLSRKKLMTFYINS